MFVELYDRTYAALTRIHIHSSLSISINIINVIVEIITENKHHNALYYVLCNQIMTFYHIATEHNNNKKHTDTKNVIDLYRVTILTPFLKKKNESKCKESLFGLVDQYDYWINVTQRIFLLPKSFDQQL